MSLIWNKLEVDNTVARFFRFQNRSLVPTSLVHIAVSADKPTTDTKGLIVVSRQFLPLVVQVGENVWFAEEAGGVFTQTNVTMPKLQNYNIESMHTNVLVDTAPVSINVPEGATITLQNLSESNLGVRIGSGQTGGFILSKNQLIAESFPRQDIVTLVPDVNGTASSVSYSITQSAIITQLSPEAQLELDQMKASIEVLMDNMVSDADITALEARLYHGNWSAPNFIQKSNTNILVSFPFLSNIVTYHSMGVQDNYGFEGVYDVSLKFENDLGNLVTERGTLYIKGVYKSTGVGELLVSRCSNLEIAKLIEQVKVNVSSDRREIVLGLSLYKTVVTSSMTTMIRIENNYLEPTQSDMTDINFITSYNVDIVNSTVVVSTDIDKILKTLTRTINASETKVIGSIKEILDRTEEIRNILFNVKRITFGDNFHLDIYDSDESLFTKLIIPTGLVDNKYNVLGILSLASSLKFKMTLNMSVVTRVKEITEAQSTRTILTDIEKISNGALMTLFLSKLTVNDMLTVTLREGGAN